MTSKINYGASKRRTNTDIASKITKPFGYSVLQDLMIGRFYGCPARRRPGFTRLRTPRAFRLGHPVTIPYARKRGVPPLDEEARGGGGLPTPPPARPRG